jgi:hypothetical protein
VDAETFFPVRRRRVLWMVWVNVPLVVAASVGLLALGVRQPMGGHTWFVALGVLLLVTMVPSWIWWFRLLRRIVRGERPGLTVDSGGFEDTVTLGSIGRVPWPRVRHWWVGTANHQTMLYVELEEGYPVLAGDLDPSRQSGWAGLRERLSRRRPGMPTAIQLNNLQTTVPEVLAAFERASEREADGDVARLAAEPAGSGDDVGANGAERPRTRPRPPGRRHQWYWLGALAVALFGLLGGITVVAPGLDLSDPFFLVPVGALAVLLLNGVREVFSVSDAPVACVDVPGPGPHDRVQRKGRTTAKVANELAAQYRAAGVDAVARYHPAAIAQWVTLQLVGASVLVTGMFAALGGHGLGWWAVALAGFGVLVLADIPDRASESR